MQILSVSKHDSTKISTIANVVGAEGENYVNAVWIGWRPLRKRKLNDTNLWQTGNLGFSWPCGKGKGIEDLIFYSLKESISGLLYWRLWKNSCRHSATTTKKHSEGRNALCL